MTKRTNEQVGGFQKNNRPAKMRNTEKRNKNEKSRFSDKRSIQYS